MELARSAVWNHHEVMYGINPKENARWRVMPYAYGDYILTCGEIPYQSFGLDNKKGTFGRQKFLFCWQGRKDSNPGHAVLETAVLPTELHPYARVVL